MGTQGPPPTSDEKRYRQLIKIMFDAGLSDGQREELKEIEARLDEADEEELKRDGYGSLHS